MYLFFWRANAPPSVRVSGQLDPDEAQLKAGPGGAAVQAVRAIVACEALQTNFMDLYVFFLFCLMPVLKAAPSNIRSIYD